MAFDEDTLTPLDPETAAAQLAWLQTTAQGCRVLDLGCGQGRIAAPLAAAGVQLTAIDDDPRCVAACAKAAPRATVVQGDFRDLPEGIWDVLLCLGNTFATVHDVDDAVALLGHWASRLAPGGHIVIDDLPGDLWPELAQGNWAAGLSPEGAELVWAADDAVFALRSVLDEVLPELHQGDVRMRLWTMGALRLLARAANLQGPHRPRGAAVLIFSDPKNPT